MEIVFLGSRQLNSKKEVHSLLIGRTKKDLIAISDEKGFYRRVHGEKVYYDATVARNKYDFIRPREKNKVRTKPIKKQSCLYLSEKPYQVLRFVGDERERTFLINNNGEEAFVTASFIIRNEQISNVCINMFDGEKKMPRELVGETLRRAELSEKEFYELSKALVKNLKTAEVILELMEFHTLLWTRMEKIY